MQQEIYIDFAEAIWCQQTVAFGHEKGTMYVYFSLHFLEINPAWKWKPLQFRILRHLKTKRAMDAEDRPKGKVFILASFVEFVQIQRNYG